MPSTTILNLAPANHPTGTFLGSARALPSNFDSVDINIVCTTGTQATPFTGFAHPFSDPAMSITFGLQWSWDNGSTFPGSTQATQTGISTGVWGTDKSGNPIMTPDLNLGVPFDSARGGHPNSYKPYAAIVGGPITFGITVIENTV